MTARETPGSTTRLIIEHVARCAGHDGVDTLLQHARLDHDLDALTDESAWFTYAEKVALFEAAEAVLQDPDVGRHIGESVFDGSFGTLVPVLRAMGSPAKVLRALLDASDSFCPIGDMHALELGEQHGVVVYRLHAPHEPNRHDCGYTIGLLTQVAPVFGLPAAEVEHAECQVGGAESCTYHLRWGAVPRARRTVGRRARRDRVRGLTARFWELEGATFDLVGERDTSEVLEQIAKQAADAVGATGHVLVLTDPDGSSHSTIQHGFVGGGAAFVDQAFQGLVDDGDPARIIAELTSDVRRYGHLIMLFDDGHEVIAEERTILKAHARHAAITLDAAEAIGAARKREKTASVLLQLARSLADLTTVDEVAKRIAESVPRVTDSDQSSVFLWDVDTETFIVRGAHGYASELQDEVLQRVITMDQVMASLPPLGDDGPVVLLRSQVGGDIARIMDVHGNEGIAIIPLSSRGRLRGVITCGWTDLATRPPRAVLDERLVALADQAATALENATLLEQVQHQALHDGLTALPNQTLFADRVRTEVVRAKRNRARVAVGVLDLDRFKTVNDSLGHGAGDQLLVQVSHRLASAVRAPDTIARMGGDEFTLLFPDVVDGGESIVAERILEAFTQPFEIEGHRLRISPSIGLAVYPDDGDSFDQLLKCADVAMYRAKDRGRNTWALYASGMAERAYDRLTLETDLYRALQRRELRVVYQPIVRVGDHEVVGTEALVRWAHPSLGQLLPEEFLPIAADLGLMAEIDGWVLRQACLQLGAATAAGTGPSRVSVNLSARTLAHPAVERLVADALAAGGLDPTRLVIEINEDVTAEAVIAASDALGALRSRGVRIALDNFGRGHSALSRLEQLPIDQLKVDATFLAGIDDPSSPAPVAEAIVRMGHGLGLEVVAEGVETEEQHDFCARIGFDLVQGWHLGRPTSEFDYGARSRTA